MSTTRLISLYLFLGAAGFWVPDILLNALKVNSLVVFTAMPILGFLAVYLVARSIWQSHRNPSIAVFMIAGVWFLGSAAMMIGASFSGGGFATGIFDTLGVIILGLLPPYTMIMSAYDGSLLALIVTTCLAVGAHFQFEFNHWILPPKLRIRIKRWYENRFAKDF